MGARMTDSARDSDSLADLMNRDSLERLRGFVDADWYRSRYADLHASKLDPLKHFVLFGAAEGRDPNPFFDGSWYSAQYPDVAASGYPPLLHYLNWGAVEHRNPNPRFDAAWYVEQHPEAASNPLLYHMRVGVSRNWSTERPVEIADYLPSTQAPPSCPDGIVVDVIVAAYRGLEETKRCLNSVLADPDRPAGQVIVVDDCSPDPRLAAWLGKLAGSGRVKLLRNRRNLGFVASMNRGMEEAGTHDVALLNSDTEVPRGWLRRLTAQAYAVPRVASVSPFSNNATICGYPSVSGGAPAFGFDVDAIDAACRTANAGRRVELPTTVGFCMYIRRAALNDVGLFDVRAFGAGYGEENDFCLRATAHGWRHLLACDTYVFHKGEVSFGAGADSRKRRALAELAARYPDYTLAIARHVSRDAAAPARFAATAALLRASGLPSVLMVSHELGGGVERHVAALRERLAGTANVLLLTASPGGLTLSVPALPGHSMLTIAAERVDELAAYLRTVNLRRAHVHHLLGFDRHLMALLRRLDVGFDLTVHDYFAICPQVNLLPGASLDYCGEPGPAVCNACIAQRPNYGAREILSWRREHAPLFVAAGRVLCPSQDVLDRLRRHGLARNAVLARHEAVSARKWTVRAPPLTARGPLRIAVIGVLAAHKGELSVMSLAAASEATALRFHLIGYAERRLPDDIARRISQTGKYEEADLPRLLAAARPHVVWFPAQWPETYSYTLSAAIDAGLPIVAMRIGAFPERLRGRPLTWLVEPGATTRDWLTVFGNVRATLARRRKAEGARAVVPDFYAGSYQAPLAAPVIRPAMVDLRRPGKISVAAIPERLDNGELSPCAYIRLLLPLDHPSVGDDLEVVWTDLADVQRMRADIVATQRYAVPDEASADTLAEHCRTTGARLVYDLDDDLLHIPRHHPEAGSLRPRARTVARMVRAADLVFASTEPLAAALRPSARLVRVMPNALDERLWGTPASDSRPRQGPVRILLMGSATHEADWAVVESALQRAVDVFGATISVDMIGMVGAAVLPPWVNRLTPSTLGRASYPGFVHWMTHQPPWDIGIAPLAQGAFNRCKSAIKVMDYAALGLAVLASDTPAYLGSLADGAGGRLVPAELMSWFDAISELVRRADTRRRLAEGALAALMARHTLAAQAAARRAAWQAVVNDGAAAQMQQSRVAAE
jgi:GT2 family glycosyltransferase/glycosyltransferase involved in cell wall biosynthesis